ncbi:MAG: 50S ribosomal protein L28 [Alphaproteobacteria bacterium]|nr:50S ribosomal protein L28 [Alphaproteobacteria bacterium]MDP7222540.1 50S ribosomal protein L28 [Alphaproteobacteria bacterium]
MSRRCMVTGKGVMSGNNVSHALNRTRRKFLPNVQDTSVFSEALGRKVRIRVSADGLRTLDHKGGFDAFLVNTAPSKLDPELRPVRKAVVKALDEKGVLGAAQQQ